jgi:outer membrane protein TolC
MRRSIIILLLIVLSFPVYGLSLGEAISIAQENNPEILAAKKNRDAVQSKAIKISTWPDPQIELMYEQIPQSGGNLNDASMKMYGVSQMIPFPGKLTLKRQSLEDAVKRADEKLKAKEQEIASKVNATYYTLYYIEKSIGINKENQKLLRKFSKIAEAKYVVGKATQHDALKASVELSLLNNELITLEQKKETAQAKLNTLLNQEIRRSISIPSDLTITDLDLNPQQLEELALKNRPELKAMWHALEKSKKEGTLARLDYLPDFKLKVLQREMRTTGLDGWNVSLMLNLPLWFWKKNAAVSFADSRKDEAGASYENLKNKVIFEVQEAYVRSDSARRSVELFKNEVVPQARQALKSAIRAYESDKINFLTLLNGQQTLLRSRLKYYEAFRNLGARIAELERIVGVNFDKQGGK